MAAVVYDAKYDLNKDGIVDDTDYGIFSDNMGTVNPSNPLSVACDFNGDGVVDMLDFGMFSVYGYGGEYKNGLAIGLIIVGVAIGAVAIFTHRGKGKKKK